MRNDLSAIDWQKASDGLLPAIVQDAKTGQVLMLGYMNEKALKVSMQTGYVTFFSRSKQRLWMKGESSKNTLKVVSIAADCDVDALLIRAIPSGPTCHTGAFSCFTAEELPLETLGLLIRTIQDRSTGDSAESYTNKLLEGGIDAYGAKVLEEAEELVRAAKREGRQRTVEEATDLLYHLLVLLRGQGIEIADIAEELKRRRQ